MLRMLTGLSPTSGGTVFWHGSRCGMNRQCVDRISELRAVSVLTVLENVEAPLSAGSAGCGAPQRALRIMIGGLDGFESAYPRNCPAG